MYLPSRTVYSQNINKNGKILVALISSCTFLLLVRDTQHAESGGKKWKAPLCSIREKTLLVYALVLLLQKEGWCDDVRQRIWKMRRKACEMRTI